MCFCGFIAEKSIKGQNRAVIELCDHVIIVIFVIISYCYEIPARNKRMTGNTEHYKTNTILEHMFGSVAVRTILLISIISSVSDSGAGAPPNCGKLKLLISEVMDTFRKFCDQEVELGMRTGQFPSYTE